MAMLSRARVESRGVVEETKLKLGCGIAGMRFLLLAIACAACVECGMLADVARKANQAQSLWYADESGGRFASMSHAERVTMMGVLALPPHARRASLMSAHADVLSVQAPAPVPSAFDWREQRYSHCVHSIRDQGKCGGCWAEAATEVLSDRLCLATNGSITTTLSPLDLLACDKKCRGCAGGYPDKAWEYLASSGIYSDSCMPWNLSRSLLCPLSRCQDGRLLRNQTKYFAEKKETYSVFGDIRSEIITNGPVEAVFRVYEDFMTYTGGIYKWSGVGKLLGLHAVKLLGYGAGLDNNGTSIPYWIAANSWNTSWGEQGYFRIAKGECGIDTAVTAARACVPGSPSVGCMQQ